MAILWMSGFETGNGYIFDVAQQAPGTAFYTASTRGPWSTYAMNMNTHGNSQFGIAATTEFYMGEGKLFSTGGEGKTYFYDPGGVRHLRIRRNTGGYIEVSRQEDLGGWTVLATASVVTPLNEWNYYEYHIKIANAGGVVQIKENGVTLIDFTGDTRYSGTYDTVASIGWEDSGNNDLVDDVIVSDTTGSVNNTWPGECKIIGLQPNAAGDSTQLTRGGTDSGSNYGQVDELPPNDDTDYVYGTTIGDKDLYGFEDLPTSYDSVIAVESWIRARKDDAGAASIRHVCKSGTTTSNGSDEALGTTYGYSRRILESDPDTATAWTRTGVNAAQFGVEVR